MLEFLKNLQKELNEILSQTICDEAEDKMVCIAKKYPCTFKLLTILNMLEKSEEVKMPKEQRTLFDFEGQENVQDDDK